MINYSKKSLEMQERLTAFMDEHIYPNEKAHAQQLHSAENRFATLPIMEDLKAKARKEGLWNLFIPPDHADVANPSAQWRNPFIVCDDRAAGGLF